MLYIGGSPLRKQASKFALLRKEALPRLAKLGEKKPHANPKVAFSDPGAIQEGETALAQQLKHEDRCIMRHAKPLLCPLFQNQVLHEKRDTKKWNGLD